MRDWDLEPPGTRMPWDGSSHRAPVGERITAIESEVRHLSREVWEGVSLRVEQQKSIGRMKDRLAIVEKDCEGVKASCSTVAALDARLTVMEQAGAPIRWLRKNWFAALQIALAIFGLVLVAMGKATMKDLNAWREVLTP